MRTRVAVLATILLAATACSSSSDDPLSSATTTTAAQEHPGTTGDDPGSGGGDDEGTGSGGGDDGCVDPPVWALKAQQPSDECETPPTTEEPQPQPEPQPEPELGTGDVQITLRWTSSADLDLHVFEPDGSQIFFGDPGPTATGGRLDVDSNVGCEQEASVENVYWPEGDMPLGGYRIEVRGYEVDGCGSGEYTVSATVKGRLVVDETDTVAQDEHDEYTFVAT